MQLAHAMTSLVLITNSFKANVGFVVSNKLVGKWGKICLYSKKRVICLYSHEIFSSLFRHLQALVQIVLQDCSSKCEVLALTVFKSFIAIVPYRI
jgi:hypothetical protein